MSQKPKSKPTVKTLPFREPAAPIQPPPVAARPKHGGLTREEALQNINKVVAEYRGTRLEHEILFLSMNCLKEAVDECEQARVEMKAPAPQPNVKPSEQTN